MRTIFPRDQIIRQTKAAHRSLRSLTLFSDSLCSGLFFSSYCFFFLLTFFFVLFSLQNVWSAGLFFSALVFIAFGIAWSHHLTDVFAM